MLFCFQLKWLRKDLVPTAFPARKLTQSFCHWGWRFTELRWNYIDLLWISRENTKIHARVCVCVPSNHNQRKITQPLNLTQNDPKIFIFTFFRLKLLSTTLGGHHSRTMFWYSLGQLFIKFLGWLNITAALWRREFYRFLPCFQALST